MTVLERLILDTINLLKHSAPNDATNYEWVKYGPCVLVKAEGYDLLIRKVSTRTYHVNPQFLQPGGFYYSTHTDNLEELVNRYNHACK